MNCAGNREKKNDRRFDEIFVPGAAHRHDIKGDVSGYFANIPHKLL